MALGRPFAAPDDDAIGSALDECHAAAWRTRVIRTTLSMGEQIACSSPVRSISSAASHAARVACGCSMNPAPYLDMVQRHFVLTLIARIAKAAMGVVFSTHDPDGSTVDCRSRAVAAQGRGAGLRAGGRSA